MAQEKKEDLNLAAMEDAVYRWLSENAYSIEDGGCGDVYALFSSLMAATAKPALSPGGMSRAFSKS